MIKEVDSLKSMVALITKEADSTSAMRFRMNKTDNAMWMYRKFFKNKKSRKEGNTEDTECAIVHSLLM